MLYWHYMLKGHEMPADALDGTQGGMRNGPKRVVARAWYEGNLVPGYVKQETGVGYFAFENDVVITRDEYEVLVVTDWMSIAWGIYSPKVQVFPLYALEGGSSFHCATYQIGCATVGGNDLCGFIKNRKCYVALDSEVVESNKFSILIDLTNYKLCFDDAAWEMDDDWDNSSNHESEDKHIPKITDVRIISESEDVTSVETNRPKRDSEIDYEKIGRIGLVELNTLLEKKKSAKDENLNEINHQTYLGAMTNEELAEYLSTGGTLDTASS